MVAAAHTELDKYTHTGTHTCTWYVHPHKQWKVRDGERWREKEREGRVGVGKRGRKEKERERATLVQTIKNLESNKKHTHTSLITQMHQHHPTPTQPDYIHDRPLRLPVQTNGGYSHTHGSTRQ